jgi:hypothetical protein
MTTDLLCLSILFPLNILMTKRSGKLKALPVERRQVEILRYAQNEKTIVVIKFG